MNHNINPNSTLVTGAKTNDILVSGLYEAAHIVGCTMGPCGRLVILANDAAPTATKDGHSVLNNLQLDDPWEQFGVQLLIDATKHSVGVSGDGTTTTTVLAAAMVGWGLSEIRGFLGSSEVERSLFDLYNSALKKLNLDKQTFALSENRNNLTVWVTQTVDNIDRTDSRKIDKIVNALVDINSKVQKGRNLFDVVAELERDVDFLVNHIEDTKKNVKCRDDLYGVALISTNGDEGMANIIADAWWQVGKHGMVDYRNGRHEMDTVDFTTGYVIERGFYSPSFSPAEGVVTRKDVAVLTFGVNVTPEYLVRFQAFLETAYKESPHPQSWVFIATDFDEASVSYLHKMRQGLNVEVHPVRMQGAGAVQQNLLIDAAVYSGTEVISSVEQLSEGFKVGSVDCANVSMTRTVLTQDDTTDTGVEEHVTRLEEMEGQVTDYYDSEALSMRIAKLTGGIAIIHVSGNTDAEQTERQHRYDDAIRATKSAYRHGYSLGGGYNYLALNKGIWETAPIGQLRRNAGLDPTGYGVDVNGGYLNIADGKVYTEEEYTPIDATKSQVTALKTALSVATVVLRSNGILTTQSTLHPYNRRPVK